jgi:hypothetical protein
VKVYVVTTKQREVRGERFRDVFRTEEGAEEYMDQGYLRNGHYNIIEKEVMDSEE